MAPRKRAAEEPINAPTPKRRSTRVVTKPAPSVEEPPTPDPTPEVKSSKSKGTKSKVPAKSSKRSKEPPNSTKSKAPSAPAQASGTERDPPDHVESHVSSDQVSKPILCHTYSGTHDPSKGDLIFTHGAGGTLSAPAVVNFAHGYAESSPILAFQGSMNLGARVKSFLALTSGIEGKKEETESMLRLGGRSMGARAAVMAGSQIIEGGFKGKVELVLVSYPLKSPKGDLRDEILLSLPNGVTALFVIGDKDNMCPLKELMKVRRKMKAQTSLLVVRGADHGMHAKPASAEKALGKMTGSWSAERSGVLSNEQIWWDGDTSEVNRGFLKSSAIS